MRQYFLLIMSVANSGENAILDPSVIFSFFACLCSHCEQGQAVARGWARLGFLELTPFLFYRWSKWGLTRESDLPNVMQGLKPRTSESQARILTIEQKIKMLSHTTASETLVLSKIIMMWYNHIWPKMVVMGINEITNVKYSRKIWKH